MHKRRHERPIRRVNPSGKIVWVARWTDRNQRRHSAGSYVLKGPCRKPASNGECCAQHAIDHAYDTDILSPSNYDCTVGVYAETWTQRHPRAERTNTSYNHRIGRVLDVEIEGRPFGDWPMESFGRKQVNVLVDHLLRVQGRSRIGAVGIVRVLSAMWNDAAEEDITGGNPWGVRIKPTDPRIRKQPRAIHVYSWEDMRRFARVAGELQRGQLGPSEMDRWRTAYAEPMVRVLSDCGLRLGELLALQRGDIGIPGRCLPGCDLEDPHLHVQRTAHEGSIQRGTKTDHGEVAPGRVAPLPAPTAALLAALPPRIGDGLLVPTPRGYVWREGLFYRDLWRPTQEETGLKVRPHEMRHSWVTHLRGAGVNPDELAKAAGHTVATQHARYTHPQGKAFREMNDAAGE
jgi:integrase